MHKTYYIYKEVLMQTHIICLKGFFCSVKFLNVNSKVLRNCSLASEGIIYSYLFT